MTADGHGLTVLPFIAGERGPGYAAHARAAILGLTQATRPIEILRAGLEAVALRFALMYGIVTSVLPEPKQAIATGGGLAEVAGLGADRGRRARPAAGRLRRARGVEPGRGAAGAGAARRGRERRDDAVGAARHLRARPEAHARLKAAQERHRHYYQRLVVEEQPL